MIATLFTCTLLATSAGDGPQWGAFRGNGGAGISDTKGIPDEIDVEKNALWRAEVPPGYSSPVVAGDLVVITAAKDKELFTIALDRVTGEEVWTSMIEFDGKRPGANSPASPSPVTDGEHVFVVFHSVGLVAYDMKGEELWRNEIGPFNIPHGMATSPLAWRDLVVLQVDQDLSAYVVAYDKKTGNERWKTERPGVTHSYSTPAIYEPEEGPAQLIVSGSLQVTSYSLETGKKLWWINGAAWQTMSMPVMAGDTCIVNAYMVPSSEFGFPRMDPDFAAVLAENDKDDDGKISKGEWGDDRIHMAWFILDLDGDELLDEKDWEFGVQMATATGGMFAIDPSGKGDVTESHVKWIYDKRRGLPGAPSPLVLDDTIFLIKEGSLMTSMDVASGEVKKQERIAPSDEYWASPVSADGKIITASKGGQLAVLKGAADWEVLSVHDLGEEIWSTPAIADGQVFVRTQTAMYCFQNISTD